MENEMTEADFIVLAEKADSAGRQVFAIFQDEDGNWRGAKKTGDKMQFVRDVGPETVLQLLVTHSGK